LPPLQAARKTLVQRTTETYRDRITTLQMPTHDECYDCKLGAELRTA
jgi:hypothetical protein